MTSLRRDIIYLLVIDVVFLLVLEFVLRDIPAPYPIFVTFGNIFETLAISLIASFIFYFVQVHLPRIKEKEDVFPSLAALFRNILGDEKELLTKMLGVEMDKMSEESIKVKVPQLNLYTEAPLIIGEPKGDRRANWIDYGLYRVGRIDKNWDMLMRYSAYLDSECMAIMSKFYRPGLLLSVIRDLFPLRNKKISITSVSSFIDFWHFVEVQQQYYNRVFAKYE